MSDLFVRFWLRCSIVRQQVVDASRALRGLPPETIGERVAKSPMLQKVFREFADEHFLGRVVSEKHNDD